MHRYTFLDMDIQPSCTENDKIVSSGLLDLKNKNKKKGNYIPFFLIFLVKKIYIQLLKYRDMDFYHPSNTSSNNSSLGAK